MNKWTSNDSSYNIKNIINTTRWRSHPKPDFGLNAYRNRNAGVHLCLRLGRLV